MPFHQINQICDPRKLLSNSRVLNDRRIFTQIFHQFELEDAVIQDILPRMHNSILFDILSKNIMDTIKTEEKNCTGITKSLNNYFRILNVCLTSNTFIHANYTDIFKLLEFIFDALVTIQYDDNDDISSVMGYYKKITPQSLVHFILYDINKGIQILDDHVFYCYNGISSELENDSYINECLEYFAKHDYKNIEFINFHMHSILRFKIIEIIPIEVVVQNTVNRNRGYANRKLPLYVNPQEMLYSIANFNTMKKLTDPKSYTHVTYQTANGDYGEDAGGLTRDLYTNFSKEALQYFGEQDEYKIPQHSIFITPRLWRLIGIMFARSIFYENISPSISIHPIVAYMMIYGYQSISLDHFFKTIHPFKIDYITNLRKIQEMTIDEYSTFLSLQGEETYIPKRGYIQTQILNRYIQIPIQKFILGFRAIIDASRLTSVSFLHDISFVQFWKYFRGIESYRINTADHGSLSRNLKVEPDEDAIQRIWIWDNDGDRLKDSIVRVLENLNKTDIQALKSFLQFWFGTDSISDFSHKKPLVTIMANDTYPGCFGARTCFDELYVHKSIFKCTDESALDAKVKEYIDCSLQNQSLTQSIGLNMQLM